MSESSNPTLPGYLSNAELAGQVQALVTRYNHHLDQEVALLTQPDGKVTVTNVAGEDISLPSYPAIINGAAMALDGLNGVLPQAKVAQQSAESAANLATANAKIATDDANKAAASALLSSQSADTSSTRAAAADTSATAAHNSEMAAAASASQATSSSTAAGNQAQSANASATTAQSASVTAQASSDKAKAWANTPPGQAVEPDQYSALHWAEQARLATAGAMIFQGTWDATSGSLPAHPKLGDFYLVSATGTIAGVTYSAGDMVIFDGGKWDRIDNQQTVTSVAGRTGSVTLTWADIAAKPSTFTPSSHKHDIVDVNGLQAALDAKATLGTGGNLFQGQQFQTGQYPLCAFGGNNGAEQSFIGGWNNSGIWRVWADTAHSAYSELTISHTVGPRWNGNTLWHTGSFDPSTKADKTGATFTGKVIFSGNEALQLNGMGPNGVAYLHGYLGSGDDLANIKRIGSSNYAWTFNGTINATSDLLVNGRSVWHTGNFDPNNRPASSITSGQFSDDRIGTLSAGSRLGAGTSKTVTDWNAALENGFYMASNGANAPAGDWMLGQATVHNSDWVTQEVWQFTSGARPQPRWTRNKLGGNWQPWKRIDNPRTWVQGNDPGGAADEGDLWIW